jgi:hypothetical protein
LIFDFKTNSTAICDLILERQPRKLSGLQIQIRRRPRRSRHERFLGTDLAENRAVGTE